MSTEQPGVYAIVHRETNRKYIGSTANLSKRWSRHRQELRDGIHRNKHLQAAWNKYGCAAFDWRILVICEPAWRIQLEQRCIDLWKTTNPEFGFNRAAIAGVSYGGGLWEQTPEWKHKHALQQRALKMDQRHTAGALCPEGHVKDGTYTKKVVGRTGLVRIKVRCQECERTNARERNRRNRGIPLDYPPRKHYNRRGGGR